MGITYQHESSAKVCREYKRKITDERRVECNSAIVIPHIPSAGAAAARIIEETKSEKKRGKSMNWWEWCRTKRKFEIKNAINVDNIDDR